MFDNPGDVISMSCLSRRLTNNNKFLQECLQWIEEKFSEADLKYILIKNHPRNKFKQLKYIYNIFPTPSTEVARPIFFRIE